MVSSDGFDFSQPAFIRLCRVYSERTRGLVAWVGSGLSRPAGLPSWAELRQALLSEGEHKAASFNKDDGDRLRRQLDGLTKVSDNWVAFERLKDLLGNASFSAAVREALTVRPGVEPPQEYRLLWKLRIGGMLTLNLDRLAVRAFFKDEPSSFVNEMTGKDAPRRLEAFKGHVPFVVNLHGILDDSSTWVLTRTDLSALLLEPAYERFLALMFSARTILFVGISADDISVYRALERLGREGVDPGSHFWITSRRDRETDVWAEDHNIQVIRYDDSRGHQQLSQAFEELCRYIPVDPPEPTPIIISPIRPSPTLPPPMELAREQPEEIRQLLAARARDIVDSDKPDAESIYRQLRDEYKRAIYLAWFVEIGDYVFGHKIEEEIGHGAFSTVYRAVSGSGQQVALKLLRPELLKDEKTLGAFRRGVRSMRILNERGVIGMVPYREAYELPGCVVMDFIEGPNLEQAVSENRVTDWGALLKIALDTAAIIHRGHLLPEQVLHRDIRPPNIMLDDFYLSEINVVVLDFDLSWHRGATELSIDLRDSSALGYLAPEQIQDTPGITTRSAAVDAFGFGMTLYFLFTRKHPRPGISVSPHWEQELTGEVHGSGRLEWKSLARRIARLIARSTVEEQRRRMDFGEIVSELQRLREAWLDPHEVESAELWAEELLSRSFGRDAYRWDINTLAGEVVQAGGLRFSLRGDEAAGKVLLSMGWAFAGEQERRKIGKYLPSKVDQLVADLRSGGWEVLGKSSTTRDFNVQSEITVNSLQLDSGRAANALAGAGRRIQF